MDMADDTASHHVPDKEGEQAVQEENIRLNAAVQHVMTAYRRNKDFRLSQEQRWLEQYSNYRGIYNKSVQFTDTEKSRAFIKITKTKVIAAFNQVVDVLFAGNRFPLSVEATPVPTDNISDVVSFEPGKKEAAPKQESELPATIARPDIVAKLGIAKKVLEPYKDELKEEPGKSEQSVTYEPAKMAARKMDKKIQDQLEEADAETHLRYCAFEMCLFGSGVMKGPFASVREYPYWNKDTGAYEPQFEDAPDLEARSVWCIYPDADARNANDCENVVDRHRMSRSQLRKLKKRPFFRAESIEQAIKQGPNYVPEWWENELDLINDENQTTMPDRYEVLEYWGIIDQETAVEAGLDIPKELRDLDDLQVNIWVCNNALLRIVLNPFKPRRLPYLITPYEVNPYSVWGIGVAENMTDTQLLMNGFMRMAVDNAALSGNLVFEIDESMLVSGTDMKVYPGKIFRRQSGVPGQSVFANKFPNISNELFMMFDKARQLADESTGIPSYSHGQTGVSGVGRTASGMSMLMGAAAQNIKGVVRNIDDYLLNPLGKALFAFNMQFNFDKEFVGDLCIVAKGTESLLRNEVRSQKILQLLQFASASPAMQSLINNPYLLREYAASLDLDEDKVVYDMREALIQAAEMAKLQEEAMANLTPEQQAQMAQQQQQQAASAGEQAAPSASDPTQTGNGNIAPGAAPTPGEAGFTGEQAA